MRCHRPFVLGRECPPSYRCHIWPAALLLRRGVGRPRGMAWIPPNRVGYSGPEVPASLSERFPGINQQPAEIHIPSGVGISASRPVAASAVPQSSFSRHAWPERSRRIPDTENTGRLFRDTIVVREPGFADELTPRRPQQSWWGVPPCPIPSGIRSRVSFHLSSRLQARKMKGARTSTPKASRGV